MSARSSRRPPPPPPKKSRTGLIILIVAIIVIVIIVVIIIIIILMRRSSTTPTPTTCTTNADCTGGKICSGGTCITPTGCSTNADCTGGKICESGTCVTPTTCTTNAQCPSGKVCDTANSICVNCLANSDCSGATPACVNKTCKACAINTDCPAANPICTATNTCIQCNTNPDCSGNTVYSTQGLNICNDHVCIECLTTADCTSPAVCTSGHCCDVTPPVLTFAVTPTMNPAGSSDFFDGTFNYVQTPSSVKYKVRVMCNTADFTASINGTTMTVTIFDTTQYPLQVGQYIYGPTVTGLPRITALGTGTGGSGTYTIDTESSQTVASGVLTSMTQIFVTPTALTTAASPQNFTITTGDLGKRLEPNTGYFFGIELTITCGSITKTANSNWGYGGTPNFSTGLYPVVSWDNPQINNPTNTFQLFGFRTLGYDFSQEPIMTISKWSNNNAHLMGILDKTLPPVPIGVMVVFPADRYHISFGSLVHTTGETWYVGIKPWGPTSYHNWQFLSAVNP